MNKSFEIRKKRKYAKVEEFVKEMMKKHEEAKAVLTRLQEKIKKYADKNRKKTVEYKVEDKVLLSTKNLTWQITIC